VVRLFVAIDLPCDITERLSMPQETLRKSRARLSLVNPSIIHLTLKFIGEIPEDRVERIKTALSTVEFPSFELKVGCISADKPRQPRVVWCGITDEGKTALLHDLVENALAPLGVPRDSRPFRPHATIARVRRFDPSLLSSISEIPVSEFGSCMVSSWQLKKSTLTPQGPVYETILEVPCT
jgi:2'-5' RNA ligase